MKTKKIKLYQYSEAPEDVKRKILERHGDINVSHEWWEFIYGDARAVGIKITSFDERNCNGDFIGDALETAHKIVDQHGEDCETYKTANNFLAERNEIVDTAPKDQYGEYEDERAIDNDLDACEDEFKRFILEDYRIMLNKEYEYQTSEPALAETFEANGYYFDETGRIQTPDEGD